MGWYWPARGCSWNKNETSFHDEWKSSDKTWLKIFLNSFPDMKGLFGANLTKGGAALIRGEFLRYLGLWMLMGTCIGWNCEHYWKKMANHDVNFPCQMISFFWSSRVTLRKSQCNSILQSLLPGSISTNFGMYKRFWWHGIQTWHHNAFLVGWPVLTKVCPSASSIVCVQDGYFFLINHSLLMFGIEYHTACCGWRGILFSMEMFPGKDQPKEIHPLLWKTWKDWWVDLTYCHSKINRILVKFCLEGMFWKCLVARFCLKQLRSKWSRIKLLMPEIDQNEILICCHYHFQLLPILLTPILPTTMELSERSLITPLFLAETQELDMFHCSLPIDCICL